MLGPFKTNSHLYFSLLSKSRRSFIPHQFSTTNKRINSKLHQLQKIRSQQLQKHPFESDLPMRSNTSTSSEPIRSQKRDISLDQLDPKPVTIQSTFKDPKTQKEYSYSESPFDILKEPLSFNGSQISLDSLVKKGGTPDERAQHNYEQMTMGAKQAALIQSETQKMSLAEQGVANQLRLDTQHWDESNQSAKKIIPSSSDASPDDEESKLTDDIIKDIKENSLEYHLVNQYISDSLNFIQPADQDEALELSSNPEYIKFEQEAEYEMARIRAIYAQMTPNSINHAASQMAAQQVLERVYEKHKKMQKQRNRVREFAKVHDEIKRGVGDSRELQKTKDRLSDSHQLLKSMDIPIDTTDIVESSAKNQAPPPAPSQEFLDELETTAEAHSLDSIPSDTEMESLLANAKEAEIEAQGIFERISRNEFRNPKNVKLEEDFDLDEILAN